MREVASYFGLDEVRARSVMAEVVASVADWRAVARRHGLRPIDVERMESAFEHDDLERARRVVGAA